jgi:fermentation-respiration switch protein FrsA (DUF1100 family)
MKQSAIYILSACTILSGCDTMSSSRPSAVGDAGAGTKVGAPDRGKAGKRDMSLDAGFIFFPNRYPEGDWQPRGFTFEDAWIQTEDGVRIHGWYCPVDRPRAVVLACHGNAGNITLSASRLTMLTKRFHVSVLMFDYRGYGRSDGQPSEKGVLADGRAARAWLASKANVKEKDVVLLGSSLGGGVAVQLAAERGARGLILENTFSSMVDVAAHHYPGLPVSWLMTNRFESARHIGAYHGPLLQVHGDADQIVPFESGRKLFAAANEQKKFVRIAGGDHNDPPTEDYLKELDAFLTGLK